MSQIVDELRAVATQIETETQVGGNTAARVGGAFNKVADCLDGTQQIADLDAAVAAVQAQAQASEQTIQDLVNNLAVTQTTGQSTSDVMSQKAVTDKLDDLSENLQDVEDEVTAHSDSGFNPINETTSSSAYLSLTLGNHSIEAKLLQNLSSARQCAIYYTLLQSGKKYTLSFDYVSAFDFTVTIRKTNDGVMLTSGRQSAGSGHVSVSGTLDADSVYIGILANNGSTNQKLDLTNFYIYEDISLKDNLKHQITPVIGSYYKLDVEIGSVANTIVSNVPAWQYARIPVEEGDVICITGNSGDIPRLWGYLGSDYTLLDVAQASETANKLVKVIPSGVSYIVINSTVNSHPQWYYAKAGSVGADELLAYKTQQKLDAIYEGVDISEQFVFTNNAGIATDTTPPGKYATNSKFTSWKATQGFVDISQYNYILVTVPNIQNSSLGIAFYSEANEATCMYAEASTLEGAGRIKVKSYDVSSYNYMRLTFTQGNDIFSCVASIRQNYQSAGKNANEILVAASDAPSDVIAQADFVCSGSHDEVTIQNAINAFVAGKKSCIRLSKGIFNIDAFPNYLATDEGDTYTAIALPNTGTLPEIRIFGSGNRAGGGGTTQLNITQTAHSTIVSNAQYKVIGGKSFQYSYGSKCCVLLSDFDIHLNSNQYPILGIDMSLVNRVKIDRIFMKATEAGKFVSQPRPVEGCIGLRMTSGSNWGTENDYRNISVYGFYEGFQVGGESVLAENLCSINAVYGYTFGNYHWKDSFNHKIVMIGIADERMENLPLFAESGYASSPGSAANTPFEVVLLGYSTEFIAPVWSNNAINYATESHPNGYCGVITYTHETDVRANQVNIPFWAVGMGKNFKTSNSAQLEVTTKAILKTYAPNYNQIVYCTDLQKPLICTEPSTKEWRDFMGNVVDINS